MNRIELANECICIIKILEELAPHYGKQIKLNYDKELSLNKQFREKDSIKYSQYLKFLSVVGIIDEFKTEDDFAHVTVSPNIFGFYIKHIDGIETIVDPQTLFSLDDIFEEFGRIFKTEQPSHCEVCCDCEVEI